MKKDLLIIGNWKMHKDLKQTKKFMDEFTRLYKENTPKISEKVKFGIAPSFISLFNAGQASPLNTILVAQNMSAHQEGAYTGEISPLMLKDVNVQMVILGHSERRHFFHENNQIINQKILLALENSLTPILCVGETLAEYEEGKRFEVVKKQLNECLAQVEDVTKVVIAYEPVWAIGTGKTATPKDAEAMCRFIRNNTHDDIIVQYGGSVNKGNIAKLMSMPNINGALVGSASLDADSMIKLITLNN